MNTPITASPQETKYFRSTLFYVAFLIVFNVVVAVLLWNRPSTLITIEWVPVDLLYWGFTGGMVRVIYGLVYRRELDVSGTWVNNWVLARPFIGVTMGALVYFLVAGGATFLKDANALTSNQLLLNALVFIAGFNDRLSVDLIERFVSKYLPSPSRQRSDAVRVSESSTITDASDSNNAAMKHSAAELPIPNQRQPTTLVNSSTQQSHLNGLIFFGAISLVLNLCMILLVWRMQRTRTE